MTRSILFVCTGNACRSQMAEGLARHLLPPEVKVASAGTQPQGLNPRAVAAMAELGLDISQQRSKSLSEVSQDGLSDVITLCGGAAESCPSVPGASRDHWPVDDPAAAEASGDEAAIQEAFAAARDDVLARVLALAAQMPVEPCVGVLGGTGFYELPGLGELRAVRVQTPFGPPSDDLMVGRLADRKVVFLARHGRGHRILPSELNQRANIYALKRMGVRKLLAVSAVGSLREHIAPGDPVLARQLIDRTHGRPRTFFGEGLVAHVSLADPVCLGLSGKLEAAAREVVDAAEATVHVGGTYVCIEGPQFSTRAESELMRAWGADLVGMTALPEARLAREAEICYAPVCMPTDYDCWHPHEGDVQVDDVLATLKSNADKGRRILAQTLEHLDPLEPCACQSCLDVSLLTQPEAIAPRARVRLHAVLARRLGG